MAINSCQKINVNVNFTGMKAPYLDKGRFVYPILENISASTMKQIEKFTQKTENKAESGNIFYLGQDLVIKMYKGTSAIIKDKLQETKILDLLYTLQKKDSLRSLPLQKDLYQYFIDCFRYTTHNSISQRIYERIPKQVITTTKSQPIFADFMI